jgi:predicted glycosyltransferase involved in capsule biosynthesis
MTDLSETSIIIHYRKDSDDRAFNLKTITDFLIREINFKQLIIVNDNDKVDHEMLDFKGIDKVYPIFYENTDHFKKAASFNYGRSVATGKVLCFYDVDALIEPKYLKMAQDEILNGVADHVYPFSGSFRNIKKEAFGNILNPVDFDKIKNLNSDLVEWASDTSPGGCNMISKEAFDKIKGYDINFIGWGFEDTDFYERSTRNNRVKYLKDTDSTCWHLDHASAIRVENPHYQNNLNVFIRNNRP